MQIAMICYECCKLCDVAMMTIKLHTKLEYVQASEKLTKGIVFEDIPLEETDGVDSKTLQLRERKKKLYILFCLM